MSINNKVIRAVQAYFEQNLPGLLAHALDPECGTPEQVYREIAARVRAEAVAGITEAIREVLPEALGHNSLPDIVRGIGRQRDCQHELKDHLADVARRLTDERDSAVAEAVAEERQRIAELVTAALVPDDVDEWSDNNEGWNRALGRVLRDLRAAAGSVPVATPTHGDHEFAPGVDVDMADEGRQPDARWCNSCGEKRGTMTEQQETDGDLLARMGTDGAKWAAEFAAVIRREGHAELAILDPTPGGLLHGWFANAIEAGQGAQLEANDFWPPLGSYHWRCAEALLKITRWDEWLSWGNKRQGEEITKLASALAQVIPDSDVSRYVRERLLVAETGRLDS